MTCALWSIVKQNKASAYTFILKFSQNYCTFGLENNICKQCSNDHICGARLMMVSTKWIVLNNVNHACLTRWPIYGENIAHLLLLVLYQANLQFCSHRKQGIYIDNYKQILCFTLGDI